MWYFTGYLFLVKICRSSFCCIIFCCNSFCWNIFVAKVFVLIFCAGAVFVLIFFAGTVLAAEVFVTSIILSHITTKSTIALTKYLPFSQVHVLGLQIWSFSSTWCFLRFWHSHWHLSLFQFWLEGHFLPSNLH